MLMLNPLSVNLLVTSKCNASCPCCNQRNFSGDLPLGEIERIARELTPKYMPIGGGEPLLREDLGKIAETIRRYSVPAVTTNGLLIEERIEELKKFHQVQVSLNGFRSTHESVKDTEFREVIKGIRTLRKKGIRFGVNTILTDDVVKELRRFIKFCLSLGAADVRLLAPKPPLEMPDRIEVPRHEKVHIDGCLAAAQGIAFGCMAGRFGCTVFPNCQASPCSHIYRPLGRLTRELWIRGFEELRREKFKTCELFEMEGKYEGLCAEKYSAG